MDLEAAAGADGASFGLAGAMAYAEKRGLVPNTERRGGGWAEDPRGLGAGSADLLCCKEKNPQPGSLPCVQRTAETPWWEGRGYLHLVRAQQEGSIHVTASP